MPEKTKFIACPNCDTKKDDDACVFAIHTVTIEGKKVKACCPNTSRKTAGKPVARAGKK